MQFLRGWKFDEIEGKSSPKKNEILINMRNIVL